MPSFRKTPLTTDGPLRDPDLRDVPPRRPRRWREEVVGASGASLLVGLWLIASPWLLDFGRDDPAWNAVVFGSLVCVFAAIRVAGAWGASVLSWLNSLIGAWLFVSAFTLAQSDQATWSLALAGGLVFFLAIWSASATEGRRTVV